jgi:environmental stress-induced protein Ves
MARILRKDDFTFMPWKNGGGSTVELYKVPRLNQEEGFYFRLSVANVEKDGPFSIFPGIDRTLICLSGEGFKLKFNHHEKILKPLDISEFRGEEEIYCELVNGPCQDFNVMVDRSWGKVSMEIKQIRPQKIEHLCFRYQTFLYIHFPSPELVVLDPGEVYDMNSSEAITLITVEILP